MLFGGGGGSDVKLSIGNKDKSTPLSTEDAYTSICLF